MGSILPMAGQCSGVCPHLQIFRVTVPVQLTWPDHSAQCSGVGGHKPCPATSPLGVGSFPASSHMAISVYFSPWLLCLWRPHATSSLICCTIHSPCSVPFQVASSQHMCYLWLTFLAQAPHTLPSILYHHEGGSVHFLM